MPRKRDDMLANLVRKGFERAETGDHHQLFYLTMSDGKRTRLPTKISRSSSHRDVSDNNLSNMARQVGLTSKQFLALVDCPLSREQFEHIIR